ncbi:MAG: rhodanese-like domain-containing protein [Betaproteobacteria bacterium]|nr:rhodanese-like domain-containing protein [Betaproteobacteria bacterium]
MKTALFAVLSMTLAVNMGFAQNANYPKAKVSFDDFKGLTAEVEAHRAARLIDLNTFLKMSKEPGVIILDSRSAFRYERVHVKGAKHLAFTDFTQDALARVIPSFDTKILIYCNNNFDGNQVDFASKVAMPRLGPRDRVASQLSAQAKPIMMALNIPTYINLYGYGYRNVYELDELVDVNDPRIVFEGSMVSKK